MDDNVRRAMERWPGVPPVAGWLRLDTTGRWWIEDGPVTHRGLIEFINRNYAADDAGRWFFQNGPQRAYVRLDYTPWILHLDADGNLLAHTGAPVRPIGPALIDDEGHLLLVTERGPGLFDSDSLPRVIDGLVDAAGGPAGEDRLAAGDTSDVYLRLGGETFAVEAVERAAVPRRFGFVPDPAAEADGA